jgi:hypothetical protein
VLVLAPAVFAGKENVALLEAAIYNLQMIRVGIFIFIWLMATLNISQR